MAEPGAVTFIASCYVMMLIRALAMFINFTAMELICVGSEILIRGSVSPT